VTEFFEYCAGTTSTIIMDNVRGAEIALSYADSAMCWKFEKSWFDAGKGKQISPNRSNWLWAPFTLIHLVLRFFLRQPGHEAERSLSSGTGAKNELGHASTTTPPPISLNGVHRDTFSVTFTENILMIRAIIRI
jgi:hypothetical protein